MMMPDLRSREFERILLIKPSAVGDVVHTLPVLVKLRARYPRARIDWLITPENADVVQHHPALSGILLFPRRQFSRFGRDWSATFGPFALLARIRSERYDLVIDLHGQIRSAIFTLASGAQVRIGFDRPRGITVPAGSRRVAGLLGQHGWSGAREGAWLAYTHRIAIPTLDIHAVDRYLWLGPMLGLDESPPDLRIHLAQGAADQVNDLLRRHRLDGEPLAILVPGTIWQTKHWHVEGFAEVGRHLMNSGMSVAIVGTPRDRARANKIVAACPGAHNLCGETTVAGLVEVVRRAVICVTNDSGAMHVAVAVGSPVVSIFGPTNPTWIGPYMRPSAVVRLDLPCSPCNLRRLRHCRFGHVCMKNVTGAMVIARAEQVLADAQSPARGLLHDRAGRP
jgi:lipopolysaccharide heptosyltransferase II